MARIVWFLLAFASVTAIHAAGMEPPEPTPTPSPSPPDRFELRFEGKAHLRHSKDVRLATAFPFPPSMIPAGQSAVFLRTVDPGTSAEVSGLGVQANGHLTPVVSARLEVHVIDLYTRNPTSSDDVVALREAWLRFGRKAEFLRDGPGTAFYVQAGKFPRFSRRAVRLLESYGLWGTAVGRLEEVGFEAGGQLGSHVYWRGSVTGGNPLFFRDANSLAGDNGAAGRLESPPTAVYESGFPLLYDAKAQEADLDGRFMFGGGLGARWLSEDTERALDVLAWYFTRELEGAAYLRGTFYEGDLDLLGGAGIRLPFRGRDKWELGLNAEARLRELRGFFQYVRQEIAGLPRDGFEAELAWRLPLGGVFASGDEPVLNWLELVARYSRIDNEFEMPAAFVAPSVGVDRRKLDVGVRIGILRGVDLTAEYAFSKLVTGAEAVRPDEGLVTLRFAF